MDIILFKTVVGILLIIIYLCMIGATYGIVQEDKHPKSYLSLIIRNICVILFLYLSYSIGNYFVR